MDCSPLGSSLRGILQARILEWVAMPSSRGSSWPRDQTHVFYFPCIGRQILYQQCHLGSLLYTFVVQLSSRVQLFATPRTAACQASLSFTVSLSFLKLMTTESVMPSSHLIFYRPLLLLPSVLPSIRVSSTESSVHIRWLKYWSFSISPSSEYLGLISFRIEWFDFLASKGLASPAPQFESISSSALSLLYGPAMTPVRDSWKNHSSDCMDLCWQNDVSVF